MAWLRICIIGGVMLWILYHTSVSTGTWVPLMIEVVPVSVHFYVNLNY
jgi:hypothetical protein